MAIRDNTSLKLLGLSANKNYKKLEFLKLDITFIYLLHIPYWKEVGEKRNEKHKYQCKNNKKNWERVMQ